MPSTWKFMEQVFGRDIATGPWMVPLSAFAPFNTLICPSGVSREAPDGSILANPDRKPCQSFNKKGGLHGSLYFSKNWTQRP